jgi:Tol biopolymer transport system component
VGDTNLVDDIFLRDLANATTVRASVSSTGAQSDGDSRLAALSSDGHYLVFESDASNLVTGDTNGVTDIFVRDTVANTTTRIPRGTDGGNPNGASTRPSISADGRFITFQSDASNLVAGDLGGYTDIFVYDQQTGTTTRASTTSDSRTSGNDNSQSPFLSPDGRFIVFLSRAQNLVGTADTTAFFDVFVTSRSP